MRLNRDYFPRVEFDNPPPHYCEVYTEHASCGAAVEYCAQDTRGYFYASNNEYATQVNYCPFCGTKAPLAANTD